MKFVMRGVLHVLYGIDEASEGVKTVSGTAVNGDYRWQAFGKLTRARLNIKKFAVAGLNPWIDFRFKAREHIFVSGALFQAMSDAEMTGFAAQLIWSEV